MHAPQILRAHRRKIDLWPVRRVADTLRHEPARDETAEDSATQRFWPWFGLAVLAFCWIAEASMCAARGF
jgi:hypothetical protein